MSVRHQKPRYIAYMSIRISLPTLGTYLKEFSVTLNSELLLVTGINGAGKSQLISGISTGEVKFYIEEQLIPSSRILKFDPHSFFAYQPHSDRHSRYGIYNGYPEVNFSELHPLIQNYPDNITAAHEAITRLVGLFENEFSDELRLALENRDSTSVAQIIQQAKIKKYNSSISFALKNYYDTVARLKIADIFTGGGYPSILPQDTIDVEEILNSILAMLKLDYIIYGKEEYVQSIINRKMLQIGIVTAENQQAESQNFGDSNFNIRFLNKRTGKVVGAELLSSGEKALLNIGSIIANDLQYDATHLPPLVLMLDEADAHLHPDYIQILIELLKNTFIEKNNFRVLISTHSPITLSLSGVNEAILIRNGEPEVVPLSVALSNLMSGISHIDVLNRENIYTALHNVLSRQISYKSSPIFLPSAHGEGGGNCDLVKHLVLNLPKERVFHGIIDWDLSNEPSERLHVLAHGTRYAIENILFDPLILTTFCISRGIKPQFVSNELDKIVTMDYLSDFELQQAITSQWTEGIMGSSPFSLHAYKYLGGSVLSLDASYMTCQGHDLESKIRKQVPQLGRYNQNLHDEILRLIRDYPSVIPIEVAELMNALLK